MNRTSIPKLMKLSIHSTLIDRVLCAALLTLYSTLARADTVILETASMGSTCNCGGIAILSSQFLGSRFHIADAMTITRVGGHFASGQNGAGGEIFAAIVQLAGPDAFPAGLPFAPGEVLATTLVTVPTESSAECLFLSQSPFSPVTTSLSSDRDCSARPGKAR